jgi:hypothetical protein
MLLRRSAVDPLPPVSAAQFLFKTIRLIRRQN